MMEQDADGLGVQMGNTSWYSTHADRYRKCCPKCSSARLPGEKSEGKPRATVELKLAAKVCRQSCSLS